MHDAAFAANGIDARYELRELAPEDLSGFVAEARGEEWLGFQITAPYKRDVMPLLDRVEPEAQAIGAVNSVAREDGALVGFNTDAPGWAAAVRRDLGLDLAGLRVVIAGAGGAAHAVAHAAVAGGAAEVRVIARTPGPARALAARVAGVVPGTLDGSKAAHALGAADLVVNATTVGMLSSGTVIDPAVLRADTAVFDLVYVPVETELLRAARARGLRAAGGAGMLVAQAAIAFRRWTGVPDVTGVMTAAVEPLLAAAEAP
jgi:shikimate dehydrogenase